MDRVIGPYREWRASLRSGLQWLAKAGAAAGQGPDDTARAALAEALRYVEGTLLPASLAEEFTLFPAVDGVLGLTGSCGVLEQQHEAMRQMAGDLRQVAAAAEKAIGELQAIVPVHYEVSSWALKKGLTYTGRADQYTYAFDVRPGK
jgi:hypothetical protein